MYFLIYVYFTEENYITSCIDVQTYTNRWGHEMSWSIKGAKTNISCTNSQEYANDGCYNEKCCLPTIDDAFVITCYDAFGDGWRNEYLAVNGRPVCGNFKGYNFTIMIQNPIKKECAAGRKTFNIQFKKF